jgi:hypothetical protein
MARARHLTRTHRFLLRLLAPPAVAAVNRHLFCLAGRRARHRALDDIRERMRLHEVRASSTYNVHRSGDGW